MSPCDPNMISSLMFIFHAFSGSKLIVCNQGVDLAMDHKSASQPALRKDVITFAATVSACEKAGVEGDEFPFWINHITSNNALVGLTHLAVCGYLLI